MHKFSVTAHGTSQRMPAGVRGPQERTGMTAMTRNSRWLITLLAATSLLASACANDAEDEAAGGGAEATASDEPIVIGGTLGLTGTYAGPSAGYKIAYDYWL